ncbi:MAG: hypothetical protein IH597_07295 [Bacteroidales bacterium]|nr:hypothetical protein [Bacteroidales bacterium]
MAAQKAIASRQNREFIFDIVGGIEIFTGKDSVKGFMDNYILRLAEALYNIAWKLENKITFNIDDEKEYFLETYYRFSERFNVPDHLTKAYEQLMAASGESD